MSLRNVKVWSRKLRENSYPIDEFVFKHGSLVGTRWHLRYLCLGTHQWTPVERMYTGGNRVVAFLGMGWRRNSDLHNDQDCDPKVAARLKFLKLFKFLLHMRL